jgi:3-oxoacyl-[acyl-carrier protein] reductase
LQNSHKCIITPDYYLDAANFDAVSNVFESIDKIDGVANFAGSLILKPAHLTSYEEYLATLHSNLTTAFATVRAAGKHMKDGGAVLLISSAAALTGFSNHEAISAAKAGIIGLVRSSAATYASYGIRINAIAPGLVDSTLSKSITQTPASLKISESMHPLGRIGSPKDVANAAAFLLNPANNWITGEIINVDGGLGNIRCKSKA